MTRPVRTWDLFRNFSRHMSWKDLGRLISGPFRPKPAKDLGRLISGPFRPKPAAVRALPARMVELGLEAPVRSAG